MIVPILHGVVAGGGGRGEFDPAGIDGLQLWFDSTEISASNGSKLAVWPDRGPLNNSAYPESPDQAFLFRNDEADTLPYVHSEQNWLMHCSGVSDVRTVIIVARWDAPDNEWAGLFGAYGSDEENIRLSHLSPAYIHGNDANNDDFTSSGGRMFIDGIEVQDGSNAPFTRGSWHIMTAISTSNRSFTPEFGEPSNGGRYMKGDYGDVIIYDRELSESELNQVHTYLADKWRIFYSGGSWMTSEVEDWGTRVITNGGRVSGRSARVTNKFVLAAKAAGYWNKINRLNLFAGADLYSALVPLKVGAGHPIDANTGFVPSDYSEQVGFVGNGVSKFLDTGVRGTHLTLNNTHLAYFSPANVAGERVEIGYIFHDTRFCLYNWNGSGPTSCMYAPPSTNGTITASMPFGSTGFYLGSRTAADSHVLYSDGEVIASSVLSHGVLDDEPIFVFGCNMNGSGSAYLLNGPLSAYSIGAGLSPAEVSAFNDDMWNFQLGLGRVPA